ncbi:MAG TPA: cytochrome c, partial [Candidatus Limnocylindria bacterium]
VNYFLVRMDRVGRTLPLIGGELAVGALAVLAAATLVTGQPSANLPRELSLPALQTQHLYGEVGKSAVHVSVDLPAPGNQRYQVGVADAKTNLPRTDVQRVFLVFTPPAGSGLAPERVQLNPSDDPAFWGATGAYTPVIGNWTVEVIVRRVGVLDETGSFPLTVSKPVPAEVVPPHDTGIAVPVALAVTWRWLPDGTGGWLLLTSILAAALGVGLLARRRPANGLALTRAGLVAAAILIGLAVGSRAVVQAANQAPPSVDASRNPTPATETSISRGEDLYEANCAACHGRTGAGDGPTAADHGLVLEPLSGTLPELSEGAIEYRIKVGTVGSGMPGFASTLSPADRWDLVNFLRARIANE